MEALMRIADASAHGILIFMGVLSVISVSIMIERFFCLRAISSSSTGVATGLKQLIASQDLAQLEKLSKDARSLEGRALGFGLNFVKIHGALGLDEFFNSFKLIE